MSPLKTSPFWSLDAPIVYLLLLTVCISPEQVCSLPCVRQESWSKRVIVLGEDRILPHACDGTHQPWHPSLGHFLALTAFLKHWCSSNARFWGICVPACKNLSGAEIPECLKEQELSNSYQKRICLQSFHSQAYEKKNVFFSNLGFQNDGTDASGFPRSVFCYFDQALSSEIFQVLAIHRIQLRF